MAAPARRPRKGPTNLSLRIDLVERSRALGLNLSQVVERALDTSRNISSRGCGAAPLPWSIW
jgi:post-segregation antitoxin (ccd killing protein)